MDKTTIVLIVGVVFAICLGVVGLVFGLMAWLDKDDSTSDGHVPVYHFHGRQALADMPKVYLHGTTTAAARTGTREVLIGKDDAFDKGKHLSVRVRVIGDGIVVGSGNTIRLKMETEDGVWTQELAYISDAYWGFGIDVTISHYPEVTNSFFVLSEVWQFEQNYVEHTHRTQDGTTYPWNFTKPTNVHIDADDLTGIECTTKTIWVH